MTLPPADQHKYAVKTMNDRQWQSVPREVTTWQWFRVLSDGKVSMPNFVGDTRNEYYVMSKAERRRQHELAKESEHFNTTTASEKRNDFLRLWEELKELMKSEYSYLDEGVIMPLSIKGKPTNIMLWNANSCFIDVFYRGAVWAIGDLLPRLNRDDSSSLRFTAFLSQVKTEVEKADLENDLIDVDIGSQLWQRLYFNSEYFGANSHFRDQVRHLLSYAFVKSLYYTRMTATTDGKSANPMSYFPLFTSMYDVKYQIYKGYCEQHKQTVPNNEYIPMFSAVALTPNQNLQEAFDVMYTRRLGAQERKADNCRHKGCQNNASRFIGNIQWPPAIAIEWKSNPDSAYLKGKQFELIVPNEKNALRYQLRSVIRHVSGNHYTCYTYQNNKWTCYDDMAVDVTKKNGGMLSTQIENFEGTFTVAVYAKTQS